VFETGFCTELNSTEQNRQPFEQSRCVEEAALAVSRLRHDGYGADMSKRLSTWKKVVRYIWQTRTDEIEKQDLQYTV
jgi:hypothetical protein